MSIERDGDLSPGLRDVDLDALPALFDTVLDRSGTGVMVFDAELVIVYVNDVAARVGGFPADVHIGRRLSDLHPQIAGQAEPALAEALERQEPVVAQELVWESPRPPHERRFWHVTYVPLRALGGDRYVAAIYVETTEARRAHERLARLIDALPTFIGMCTPDGIITEANQATLAAAGVRREDVVGRPLWEADWWRLDRTVRRRIHDAVVLAQEGRSTQLDVEVQLSDGGTLTLDLRLVPIIEHGAVTAIVPS
ncbi:MAG: PAS domain-containing protein, partial [Acidimicrobiia bacterium]